MSDMDIFVMGFSLFVAAAGTVLVLWLKRQRDHGKH